MDSPEIVLSPNPNKGREMTQLVLLKTLPQRRLAALQAKLDSFSVLYRSGDHYVKDGKEYVVPKKHALIIEGWDEITDPDKIAAYRRNVEILLKKPSKRK